jgi:hypothetical protein
MIFASPHITGEVEVVKKKILKKKLCILDLYLFF